MARKYSPVIPRSVVYFLRDVGVAFLIVGVVLGGIFAYTRVWPPMVVVESPSMTHSNDHSDVGPIDTGDLVLVQQAPLKEDIVTYVEGWARGYRTYGSYGDVIIFLRDGFTDPTPIIHRPLLYLQCNSTFSQTGCESYDIPALRDLDRSLWRTSTGGWWNLGSNDFVELYRVFDVNQGEKIVNISIAHYQQVARSRNEGMVPYSGYITKGDHNPEPDTTWLVKQDWVIGRARGEIPWFGLIKLTLFPAESNRCRSWRDLGCAPANSWDSLTVSLVVLVAAPVAFDVASSLWGRKEDKGRGRRSESPDPPKGKVRRP